MRGTLLKCWGLDDLREVPNLEYFTSLVTEKKIKEVTEHVRKAHRHNFENLRKYFDAEMLRGLVETKITETETESLNRNKTATLTATVRIFFLKVVLPNLVKEGETLVWEVVDGGPITGEMTPQLLVSRILANPDVYNIHWLQGLAESDAGCQYLNGAPSPSTPSSSSGSAISAQERMKITERHLTLDFLEKVATDLCPTGKQKKGRGLGVKTRARNVTAQQAYERRIANERAAADANKIEEETICAEANKLESELLAPMSALKKISETGILNDEQMAYCEELLKRFDAALVTHATNISYPNMATVLRTLSNKCEELEKICHEQPWAIQRVVKGMISTCDPDPLPTTSETRITGQKRKTGRPKGDSIEELTTQSQLRRSIVATLKKVKKDNALYVQKMDKLHEMVRKESKKTDEEEEEEDNDEAAQARAVDEGKEEKVKELKIKMDATAAKLKSQFKEMMDLTEGDNNKRGGISMFLTMKPGTNDQAFTNIAYSAEFPPGPGVVYNMQLCSRLMGASAPLTDAQAKQYDKDMSGNRCTKRDQSSKYQKCWNATYD
jgi:hypothetical protein